MVAGIIAGITWALETVILNVAFGMEPLLSMAIATFVATFLHDACSAIWALIYNGVRGKLGAVWRALTKTKSGKWVVIAAVIGGPIGMTGYVLTVNHMGPTMGTIASAIFPAIGSVLAFFFLKEKMKWHQWIFLIITLLGVFGLSYSPDAQGAENVNYWLGILGAFMCSFGWGIEAVILAKCLTDPEVTDEYALQIRQTTSALTYGIIILPVIGGWVPTISCFNSGSPWVVPVIVLAALFATVSYLFYYKAIAQIGASKAMALNVTYVAWAMIFALVLDFIMTGTFTAPSIVTVICAIVVLVCGIFAAADIKEIFSKKK